MALRREINGDTLSVVDESGNVVLTIKAMKSDQVTTLVVSGDITHDAAPEFEDELMSVLTSGYRVTADFSGLEYISAPALNALLTVQRLVDENRFEFHIRNISGTVKETFEQTGFIDLLEIH